MGARTELGTSDGFQIYPFARNRICIWTDLKPVRGSGEGNFFFNFLIPPVKKIKKNLL